MKRGRVKYIRDLGLRILMSVLYTRRFFNILRLLEIAS